MVKIFEENEEIALKNAYRECINKGKLFNLNKWKLKREKERVKMQEGLK
jgi:hypothetical protein